MRSRAISLKTKRPSRIAVREASLVVLEGVRGGRSRLPPSAKVDHDSDRNQTGRDENRNVH
jgi:hypothetical protein